MLLGSPVYFLFLCLVIGLYYVLPPSVGWLVLLGSSVYFYTTLDSSLVSFAVLLTVTLSTYLCGMGMAKAASPRLKAALVTLGTVVSLGLLFSLKYGDFILSQMESALGITLPRLGVQFPVGLSFYAFSTVTYLFALYRGEFQVEKHLGKFATFVTFFPKLLAGPIERAGHYLPQLKQRVHFEPANVVPALELILFGLFKKVVIADRLAALVATAYSSPRYAPPIFLILGTYLFAFQLYCDFSGYTDMARGSAKLLGIDLMENFRRPFLSQTPSEFWSRRWHVSLGTWFRDYVYIPLGGSRVSLPRRYFNLMMIFVVSGLWHAGLGYGVGWNFMVWGAYCGLYACLEVATTPLWPHLGGAVSLLKDTAVGRGLRVVWTFHVILLSLVFFRSGSLSEATTILTRIYNSLPQLPRMISMFPMTEELALSLVLIGVLILLEIIDERRPLSERLRQAPIFVRWGYRYALIMTLLVFGKWGEQAFIYMQF